MTGLLLLGVLGLWFAFSVFVALKRESRVRLSTPCAFMQWIMNTLIAILAVLLLSRYPKRIPKANNTGH